MVKVTKESLAENIGRLESYGDLAPAHEILNAQKSTLNDLLAECEHDWVEKPFPGMRDTYRFCTKCREVRQ